MSKESKKDIEESDKEEIKKLRETVELSVDALQKNMTILGSLYAKVEELETENTTLREKIKDFEGGS